MGNTGDSVGTPCTITGLGVVGLGVVGTTGTTPPTVGEIVGLVVVELGSSILLGDRVGKPVAVGGVGLDVLTSKLIDIVVDMEGGFVISNTGLVVSSGGGVGTERGGSVGCYIFCTCKRIARKVSYMVKNTFSLKKDQLVKKGKS